MSNLDPVLSTVYRQWAMQIGAFDVPRMARRMTSLPVMILITPDYCATCTPREFGVHAKDCMLGEVRSTI